MVAASATATATQRVSPLIKPAQAHWADGWPAAAAALTTDPSAASAAWTGAARPAAATSCGASCRGSGANGVDADAPTADDDDATTAAKAVAAASSVVPPGLAPGAGAPPGGGARLCALARAKARARIAADKFAELRKTAKAAESDAAVAAVAAARADAEADGGTPASRSRLTYMQYRRRLQLNQQSAAVSRVFRQRYPDELEAEVRAVEGTLVAAAATAAALRVFSIFLCVHVGCRAALRAQVSLASPVGRGRQCVGWGGGQRDKGE